MPHQRSPGEAQEEKVRRSLAGQGYAQAFGASDSEIRKRLGITGKCADFVGYLPELDKWLIAESKGNHMQAAVEQIENTLHGLLTKESDATEKTELRIYTNYRQYQRMIEDPRGASGYRINDSFLGYEPDNTFVYLEIKGVRVKVIQEGEE